MDASAVPPTSHVDEPSASPVAGTQLLLENGVVALAYVLGAIFAHYVATIPGAGTLLWPSAAVGVVALHRRGAALAPGIVLGSFVVAWMFEAPPPLIAAAPLQALIGAVVAVALLRWRHVSITLPRSTDILHLLWISFVAGLASAALNEVLQATLLGRAPDGTVGRLLQWGIGDALGVLAVVPPIALALAARGRPRRTSTGEVLGVLAAIALAGALALVVNRWPEQPRAVITLLFSFPILLWYSLRTDLSLASWFTLLLVVLAVIGARLGTGSLAFPTADGTRLSVLAAALAAVVTSLLVAGTVTEREAALAAARAAEERFERFLDRTPLLAFVKDEQGTLRFVNHTWEQVAGLSRTRLPLATAALPPTLARDRAAIAAEDRDALGGADVAYEVRVEGADGLRTWRGHKFAFEAGGERLIGGVARDVTQLLVQERAVREGGELLRLVFEGTTDLLTLWRVTPSGRPQVIMANGRWLDFMQTIVPEIPRDRLVGLTVDELHAGSLARDAHAERYAAHLIAAASGSQPQTFETPHGPGGDWDLALEHTLVALTSEDATRYVLASARDVTQRRRDERRVRESEARLSLVLDSTQDLIALFAVEGPDTFRLLQYNAVGDRLLRLLRPGLPLPDLLGADLRDLVRELVSDDPRDVERQLRHFGAAVTTGEPQHYEEPFPSPQGVRWVDVVLVPVYDDAGVPKFVLRSTRDVTQRKLAEAEVRRLNVELERRVDERTAQLQGANRDLESYSYSVSHDLRTPLRSIVGFSRALLEDHAEQLPDEGRDYAARVVAAAERMGRLIDGLLRLSRTTAGEMERELIDVSAMATDVSASLAAGSPERAVTVEIEPHMVAHADRALLQIVLDNLLANAWKFTAGRGDAHVWVGMTARDGVRTFFVRDNGAGFDMAYAARLFTPFQRLHRTDEYEGSGIGLATVHRIVSRHGGRVWAESAPQQGATFYFTCEGADAPPLLPTADARVTAIRHA
jgi:PAS domain S-box-containing protein